MLNNTVCKWLLPLLVLLPITVSAQSLNIKQIAQEYFTVYAKRDNFQAFMRFYDDNVVLEDMIYGNHIIGKPAVEEFLNWPDPHFKATSDKNLVVTKLIVDNNEAVATGYFSQFLYQSNVMGPWRFTIHLTFDAHGKIIHQIDWINYTPRQQFLGGKNMNALINKGE